MLTRVDETALQARTALLSYPEGRNDGGDLHEIRSGSGNDEDLQSMLPPHVAGGSLAVTRVHPDARLLQNGSLARATPEGLPEYSASSTVTGTMTLAMPLNARSAFKLKTLTVIEVLQAIRSSSLTGITSVR
jgi:hypothetical protein